MTGGEPPGRHRQPLPARRRDTRATGPALATGTRADPRADTDLDTHARPRGPANPTLARGDVSADPETDTALDTRVRPRATNATFDPGRGDSTQRR